MWEFPKFIWHCILEGWEIGEHAFAFIETTCFIIGAGMLWRKEHHHEAWEKWIMRIAFGILVCVFLGSSLFYVPFVHHKKSEHRIEDLSKTVTMTSSELHRVKAELKASENARLKRLEDLRADPAYPRRAWLSDADVEFIKDALKKSPKHYNKFLACSGSDDAVLFVEQVEELFRNAGFPTGLSKALAQGSEGKFSVTVSPEMLGEPLGTVLNGS